MMEKDRASITPDVLKELLQVNGETGELYWKKRADEFFKSPKAARTWNLRYAGKPALSATTSLGYRWGNIFGNMFMAHRVIWAMTTGEWPSKWIDHVDGNRKNNKWSNLREATVSQNQFNRPAQTNNTSGFKGVCRDATGRKWMAQIKFMRKCKYLGVFDTPEEAHAAYCEAADKYHGEFANTASLTPSP